MKRTPDRQPAQRETQQQQVAPPPAAPQYEAAAHVATPAPRRRSAPRGGLALADRILSSAGILAMVYLMFEIWKFGALASLTTIGSVVDMSGWGWWQWGIPLAITLVESKTGYLARVGYWWLPYTVVLIFDIGTTAAGFAATFAGVTLPIFAGATLPAGGAELWIVSSLAGIAAAFLPEPVTRVAFLNLIEVWR